MKIADQYLHVQLHSVVIVLLVLAMLAPVAVFAFYRWFPARAMRRR